MKSFLGPLDQDGRIPPHQQTRVAAFLMSAHGAQARHLAASLPGNLRDSWEVELHIQYCRELEILSLLARATSWVPDPMLAFLIWQWESAWWPQPAEGVADRHQGLLIDMAAFGHAVHAVTRPAALLPEHVSTADPFAMALRRIELESGRLMQAQTLFLKGQQFLPVRDAVAAAVERRHAQVREQLNSTLRGIEIETSGRHLMETTFQVALRSDAAYQASLQGGQAKIAHNDKAAS